MSSHGPIFIQGEAAQPPLLTDRIKLILVALGAALAAVMLAAVTTVTVPLLWPAGASLAALGAVAWGARRGRHCARCAHLDAARQALAENSNTVPTDQARPPRIIPVRPVDVDVPTTIGDQTRIGDAERDQATTILREQYAAGRLELAEVHDRIAAAMTAKTYGHLRAALLDLPT